MPRHVSSWTPAACEVWVELFDAVKRKTYCWNRRSHRTVWTAPAGVEVVWVAEKGAGGGEVWYWYKVTRVSTYDFPPSSWVMGGASSSSPPSSPSCLRFS